MVHVFFQTMVNSIKLYADNLLCMDLCCWPQGDAAELLGEEVSVDRQTGVLIVDKQKDSDTNVQKVRLMIE